MDMLTKIFAETVYHVNLKSPSISSQLSKPGARRLRGKKKDPQSGLCIADTYEAN